MEITHSIAPFRENAAIGHRRTRRSMPKGFSRPGRDIESEARSQETKRRKREERDPSEWKWSVRYAQYGIYKMSRVPIRWMYMFKSGNPLKRSGPKMDSSVPFPWKRAILSCSCVHESQKVFCVAFPYSIAPFVKACVHLRVKPSQVDLESILRKWTLRWERVSESLSDQIIALNASVHLWEILSRATHDSFTFKWTLGHVPSKIENYGWSARTRLQNYVGPELLQFDQQGGELVRRNYMMEN